MKAVMSMTLGVMTAIGGFVDIGNLVTSGITGARFGMTLTWAVLVGTIGMALFAEMAGRVTAVTRKPIFHVVRERLGVRVSPGQRGRLDAAERADAGRRARRGVAWCCRW